MAERDPLGRLKVTDETLAAQYRGCLIAVSLSVEAIARLLGCDRWEAEAFKEDAGADLARIRAWADRQAAR